MASDMKEFILKQIKYRDRFGVLISLLIHIIFFVSISCFGIFQYHYGAGNNSDVVFFSAGSSGGSSESLLSEESATNDVPIDDSQDSSIENYKEVTSSDAITDKIVNKQQNNIASTNLDNKNFQQKNRFSKSGNGVGNGTGKGHGNGSGNGNGSGRGSGNGSGNGIVKQPAVPPRIKYTVSPNYPVAQKQAGVEGLTILQLIIAINGSVESATVIQSSGNNALDNAAQQAALKWKFIPAKGSNGEKVRCYYNLPMRFSLKYN